METLTWLYRCIYAHTQHILNLNTTTDCYRTDYICYLHKIVHNLFP